MDDRIRRISDQVAADVRAESESAGQMTLEAFISALEAMPQNARCHFAGSTFSPCDPDSYRGFYDQLAFNRGHSRSVSEVLETARGAMGQMFEGYKGGEYWMTGNPMIWAAPYGSCGDRIVGVDLVGDEVVVSTAPYERD